jgi:hypothetical protein
MAPCDPMAVAVDWLDSYRAASIDQIINTYSPNAAIECACGGRKIIHGSEGIAAYWGQRFIEKPALALEELQMDGEAVVVSYRINSGIVQALLDISEDGLITRCRCGPLERGWVDAGHVGAVRKTPQGRCRVRTNPRLGDRS